MGSAHNGARRLMARRNILHKPGPGHFRSASSNRGNWDRGIQFHEVRRQKARFDSNDSVTDPKAHYVRSLFSKVPYEYDILLALLTFAQDRRWRALVVAYSRPRGYALDVATGTGLLAA